MRRLLLLVLAAAAVLTPAAAQAHPLGNFTINHYARAELSGGSLYVRYVLDMAEIPTFRERSRIDGAGGLQAYADARAPRLARQLLVTMDGRRLPLRPLSQSAALHRGAGGLKILRLAAWYQAPTPAVRGPHRVSLRDATYPGRLGWREVVVRASSGARVGDSTAPSRDVSDELRAYPGGLLSRPLEVEEATFTWTPGSGPGAVGALTRDPESTLADRDPGGFAGLVEGRLSVGVVLIALLLAMGWGALHALSPGHGKSMVAAYLVGTRGTARHAFTLGLFVTVTHTVSVVLFGLATLWLSAYILPEVLFRWLSVVAGLMVVAIGAWVLWRRTRRLRAGRAADGLHGPRAQDRADHGHPSDVHRTHHHHHGAGHGHSHAPDELSLKSLAAAGVTAGLLPCPSAMVLLLGAIALNRVGYGLVLVGAFSVGLAALVSLIGILVLYARRFVERLPLDGRIAAAVPMMSALVILVLGVVLTARALPGVI